MTQIMITTDEIRSLVEELKNASLNFDNVLLSTEIVVNKIQHNWKSPRINSLIDQYGIWRKKQKDQSYLLFELASELERLAEANEAANR